MLNIALDKNCKGQNP